MGIEKRRETIGDFKYELTTLGAKSGQKVLLRLFRILGPAAASILSNGAQGIGNALTLASGATTDADLEFITNILAENCQLVLTATGNNGATGEVPTDLAKMYDSHFAGRWSDWAMWIGWGVRTNFESFFAGKALESLVAQFKAETASGSESPKG